MLWLALLSFVLKTKESNKEKFKAQPKLPPALSKPGNVSESSIPAGTGINASAFHVLPRVCPFIPAPAHRLCHTHRTLESKDQPDYFFMDIELKKSFIYKIWTIRSWNLCDASQGSRPASGLSAGVPAMCSFRPSLLGEQMHVNLARRIKHNLICGFKRDRKQTVSGSVIDRTREFSFDTFLLTDKRKVYEMILNKGRDKISFPWLEYP